MQSITAHAATKVCPYVACSGPAPLVQPRLSHRRAQIGLTRSWRPCQPIQLPVLRAAAYLSMDEEMLARERPPSRPSPPELPEVQHCSSSVDLDSS